MSTQIIIPPHIPESVACREFIDRIVSHGLEYVNSGKTRIMFRNPEHPGVLFIKATKRLSALDVVLSRFVHFKDEVLTTMTVFSLAKQLPDVPNHLLTYGPGIMTYLPGSLCRLMRELNLATTMIAVKEAEVFPVEAIVRGYLTGSGWKDYQKTGKVCGIALPSELKDGSPLPEPIFTPSTKAPMGSHDVNISFEAMVNMVGLEVAETIRHMALDAYSQAAAYALTKGIIIADTKLEFAYDRTIGKIILVDEAFTPDSSRFWPVDGHAQALAEGLSPPSLDKEPIRVWARKVDLLHYPDTVPPDEILQATTEQYLRAIEILTDSPSLLQCQQRLGLVI